MENKIEILRMTLENDRKHAAALLADHKRAAAALIAHDDFHNAATYITMAAGAKETLRVAEQALQMLPEQ